MQEGHMTMQLLMIKEANLAAALLFNKAITIASRVHHLTLRLHSHTLQKAVIKNLLDMIKEVYPLAGSAFPWKRV